MVKVVTERAIVTKIQIRMLNVVTERALVTKIHIQNGKSVTRKTLSLLGNLTKASIVKSSIIW